jgi:hypothetical protein
MISNFLTFKLKIPRQQSTQILRHQNPKTYYDKESLALWSLLVGVEAE